MIEKLSNEFEQMKFSKNYPGQAKDESQATYDMGLQDAMTCLSKYAKGGLE